MLLPHAASVAVVDGAILKLFQNSGREGTIKLVAVPVPKIDARPSDSGHHHRSSAANPDRHLLTEDAFAAAVAGWLNQRAVEGVITQLFVIAPPRMLGELRRHYGPALVRSLVGERAKELVNASEAQIAEAITTAR